MRQVRVRAQERGERCRERHQSDREGGEEGTGFQALQAHKEQRGGGRTDLVLELGGVTCVHWYRRACIRYTHREKETGTHTDTHLRPEGTRARRRRSEQRSVGRGTVDMELADDGALPLGEFGAEGSLRAALAQPEQAWFTSLVPV